MFLPSWRRSADVDVGPCCYSGNRLAKGDERHSEPAEFAEQCSPLQAVRAQRNVDTVTMIESQTAVQACLTECAHGQCAAELRNEEALDIALYLTPRCLRKSGPDFLLGRVTIRRRNRLGRLHELPGCYCARRFEVKILAAYKAGSTCLPGRRRNPVPLAIPLRDLEVYCHSIALAKNRYNLTRN